MSSDPIRIGGDVIDLGGRIAAQTTVAASPAAALETVIATLTLPAHMRNGEHVKLDGWAAFAVGTDGASAQLRIRRGTVAGAVVANSGALTAGIAAAALAEGSVVGIDGAGEETYVLTLEVADGSAESAVSAVVLSCEIF